MLNICKEKSLERFMSKVCTEVISCCQTTRFIKGLKLICESNISMEYAWRYSADYRKTSEMFKVKYFLNNEPSHLAHIEKKSRKRLPLFQLLLREWVETRPSRSSTICCTDLPYPRLLQIDRFWTFAVSVSKGYAIWSPLLAFHFC